MLAAKDEITEALHRYCRGMDRIDNELAARTWHADGTADYGDLYRGSGSGFVEWVSAQHARMAGHSHQLANVLIRVDLDAGTATSEAYVTVVLHADRDGQLVEIRSCGRYLDRWSHRGGRWAIDDRVYLNDLGSVRAVDQAADVSERISRDRRDPSYAYVDPAP